MRSLIVLVSSLAVAACGMTAGAQEGGTGEVERRSFDVAGFDSVGLAGSHDVIVTVGGPASVRAEGDPKILEKLDIRVVGSTLRIGTQKGVNWNAGFLRNRKPVTVYVTVPSLVGASVAGSGDLKVDKIEGDRFRGAVAGSGDLQVAAIRVGEAEFSVAGSGDIRATGSAGRLKANLAGSGDLHLDGLEAKDAEVSVAGSGDIRARATGTANVSLSGSGDVTMAGGAQCSVKKRGSGEVNCQG
ncbi:MAG TPA: head GIN domain-containing protein [Allosphingosinicella sp.]